MDFGKKKSKWKSRLFWVLVLVGLTVFGVFKLFPSAFDGAKSDVMNMLGVTKESDISKDSIKVLTTDSITIKPIEFTPVSNDSSRKEIPVEIKDNTVTVIANVNGYPIRFIVDTGCTDMLLSSAELFYLEHMGVIKSNKPDSKAQCQYADGSSHECLLYTLSSVSFGDGLKVDSVKCTVEENLDAMPLLGNEVLKKLGRVSIDYTKKVLIIEN